MAKILLPLNFLMGLLLTGSGIYLLINGEFRGVALLFGLMGGFMFRLSWHWYTSLRKYGKNQSEKLTD